MYYLRHTKGELELATTDNGFVEIIHTFEENNELLSIFNRSNEIKLGLTMNGIDTTKLEGNQYQRFLSCEHIGLLDMYLHPEGYLYRTSMSKLEKEDMINVYKEWQEALSNLKTEGFRILGYTDIVYFDKLLPIDNKSRDFVDNESDSLDNESDSLDGLILNGVDIPNDKLAYPLEQSIIPFTQLLIVLIGVAAYLYV